MGESIRLVTEKKGDKNSVSPFEALMVSTASRVGTGNIVGVANAIAIGGYGAVFWMRVICGVILADVLMGVMAIINLPVIVILGKKATVALNDYCKQRKAGMAPVFKASSLGLGGKTDFWN